VLGNGQTPLIADRIGRFLVVDIVGERYTRERNVYADRASLIDKVIDSSRRVKPIVLGLNNQRLGCLVRQIGRRGDRQQDTGQLPHHFFAFLAYCMRLFFPSHPLKAVQC
jgi:hypothetical protein